MGAGGWESGGRSGVVWMREWGGGDARMGAGVVGRTSDCDIII